MNVYVIELRGQLFAATADWEEALRLWKDAVATIYYLRWRDTRVWAISQDDARWYAHITYNHRMDYENEWTILSVMNGKHKELGTGRPLIAFTDEQSKQIKEASEAGIAEAEKRRIEKGYNT